MPIWWCPDKTMQFDLEKSNLWNSLQRKRNSATSREKQQLCTWPINNKRPYFLSWYFLLIKISWTTMLPLLKYQRKDCYINKYYAGSLNVIVLLVTTCAPMSVGVFDMPNPYWYDILSYLPSFCELVTPVKSKRKKIRSYACSLGQTLTAHWI